MQVDKQRAACGQRLRRRERGPVPEEAVRRGLWCARCWSVRGPEPGADGLRGTTRIWHRPGKEQLTWCV